MSFIKALQNWKLTASNQKTTHIKMYTLCHVNTHADRHRLKETIAWEYHHLTPTTMDYRLIKHPRRETKGKLKSRQTRPSSAEAIVLLDLTLLCIVYRCFSIIKTNIDTCIYILLLLLSNLVFSPNGGVVFTEWLPVQSCLGIPTCRPNDCLLLSFLIIIMQSSNPGNFPQRIMRIRVG